MKIPIGIAKTLDISLIIIDWISEIDKGIILFGWGNDVDSLASLSAISFQDKPIWDGIQTIQRSMWL